MKESFMAAIFAISMVFYGVSEAASPVCPGSPFVNGPGEDGVGPYDYYDLDARKKYLAVVEAHHFTPSVEGLSRGSSGTVAQDLGYTLNSFPNHPRALVSLLNLVFSRPGSQLGDFSKDPECFFWRAVAFRPNDHRAKEIYGVFLYKKGRLQEAREQFAAAEVNGYDAPLFHYNFGLILVELREWEKAMHHAKKAYASGVSFPGLRRKLQQSGKWK